MARALPAFAELPGEGGFLCASDGELFQGRTAASLYLRVGEQWFRLGRERQAGHMVQVWIPMKRTPRGWAGDIPPAPVSNVVSLEDWKRDR